MLLLFCRFSFGWLFDFLRSSARSGSSRRHLGDRSLGFSLGFFFSSGLSLLSSDELGVSHVSALLGLLKLTLGRGLCILVGEGHKEATLLHKLEHSRQVLHVVEPAESVRQLDLLIGWQTREETGHVSVR